jgi:hypothetical protein
MMKHKRLFNLPPILFLFFISLFVTACALYNDYLVRRPEERYRQLEEAARLLEQGRTIQEIDARFPGLAKRLKEAQDPLLLSLWGRVSIIDASSNLPILPDLVLDRLGITSRRNAAGERRVHAGLMHSYGYLFSIIDTPHGRMGRHWIEGRIDERLGLGAGRFAPVPQKGEFLANLTWTLLTVTNRWDEQPLETRRRILSLAANDLTLTTPARAAEIIVEKTTVDGEEVRVYTAFVPLRDLVNHATIDAFLLIYWTEKGSTLELITTFPVSSDFRDRVIAAPRPPGSFVPRYNLVFT